MTIVAFLTGTLTGATAIILGRRAWPRFLLWLFSRGDT